jgi:peptidoglycan/xylan/chitin deacetylase (PgdA/CDA1 family)
LSLLLPVALCSIALAAGGCGSRRPETASAGGPSATTKVAATPPPAPPVDLAKDRPNELGRVPILEYHNISSKEDRWARTPANFRKDLDRLYRLGYRPVSLLDYVHGKIDLPPGKSPVIFTFDDADPGQFRYLGSGAAAKLDPDCAVAMLLDFQKAHPDFKAKATFYVLPSLFGQPAFESRKLHELKDWGFEIGNHTFTHPALRKLSREQGIKELAMGAGVTEKILPGYAVRSVALPLGSVPKDESILRGGSAGGVTYRHEASLLVGAEPAPSPFSERFKPFRLPRIQATETAQPSLDFWLKRLEKNPSQKFRSDGDPNVVTYLKKDKAFLNPASVKSLKTRAY